MEVNLVNLRCDTSIFLIIFHIEVEKHSKDVLLWMMEWNWHNLIYLTWYRILHWRLSLLLTANMPRDSVDFKSLADDLDFVSCEDEFEELQVILFWLVSNLNWIIYHLDYFTNYLINLKVLLPQGERFWRLRVYQCLYWWGLE